MRRILALVLTALLVLSQATGVLAAYENTYTNTGDQRKDIVQVALTQVGYTEGYNNDTKYGDWYDLPNHPWCAMFVSWCANQAGVPTNVLKKAAIANPTYFGFNSWFSASQRMPQSGDLFFKKNFNHMGLVRYVDGDYFYTVEGNTNDSGYDGIGVFSLRRKLSDYYFVSPNYTTDPGHSYYSGVESAHPHKEYKRCDHCGDSYYTGVTVTQADCQTCIIQNCSHSYGPWTPGSGQHESTCSLCGKVRYADHGYYGGTVTKYATCGAVGAMTQKCTDCGQVRNLTLPATNEHKYSDWAFDGADTHSRKCSTCGEKEVMSHVLPEEFETDGLEHWRSCQDCGEKLEWDAHSFGAQCGDPCTVCGYVPRGGHAFTDLKNDETHHWKACINCGLGEEKVPHSFENDCDDLCDGCGVTRQVNHEWGMEWNSSCHWNQCGLCGLRQEEHGHVPGPEATEEQAQVCLECGPELAPRLEHVHDNGHWEWDTDRHWGTCVCGAEFAPQLHGWDMRTGTCSVCGAKDPNYVVPGSTNYYLVGWINDADYGCESDWENMGTYKFVNGQLTAKFNSDSYIFVKTEGNGRWLLSDAYCTDTTCTFFEDTSEKMFVPGGVELDFTLVENEDGTLTLSYVTAGEPDDGGDQPGGETPEEEGGEVKYVVVGGWEAAGTWTPEASTLVMTEDDGRYIWTWVELCT